MLACLHSSLIPVSCVCESLYFHCVKSHYPKGKANERIVLWNGHRPVSCQSHLRLGEKDRKGKRRQREEGEEQSEQSSFKQCDVFLCYRCVHVSNTCIYSSPFCTCILTNKAYPFFLQSDPMSPPHLASSCILGHQAGKCEVKCLCACMCV